MTRRMMFSLAILAIVLAYTWVIDPIAPGWVTPIAVALVLGLAIWHAVRSGDWGVTSEAFLPALCRSAVLTAAAALAIYLAGSHLGTWHDRRDTWTSLALLIPWGVGQQFALHTVFLREARPPWESRPASGWRPSSSRPYICPTRSSARSRLPARSPGAGSTIGIPMCFRSPSPTRC